MRSIILLGAILGLLSYAQAQTARVQVIHNAPSPTVDVYANGDLLLDDFVFRTATPFVDVPAEVEINLAVAPGNSTSADDAIASFPVTLADGGTYIVVASGLVGGDPGFDLKIFDMAKETAPAGDQVSILFFHGSPDAPAVDIVVAGAPVFDDVSFGMFGPYIDVPSDTYTISVTPADDNGAIIASYNLDVDFWAGNSLVVFASGFLGGSDPGFEPWVALSNGGTFPLEAVAPPADELAKVQIVHNAPDAAADSVDIYVGADLLLDNFAFRNATPFVEVPADTEITVSIAPKSSTSVDDAIASYDLTFEAGKRYIAIANGLLSSDPEFTVNVIDSGRESAIAPGKFDLAVFHGSPGAPAVDIAARTVGDLVTGLEYGAFSGYLSVMPQQYYLDLKAAGDPNVLATFSADVSGLAGQAGVAIASGFLGGDPGFTIILVLADGTVVELPQTAVARVQVIHNAIAPTVDIYANSDKLIDDFVFRTATPYVTVPADVEINIGVALSDSDSSADAIATFPVTFENGKDYVVVANGVVGGDPGFGLAVFDMSSELSTDPANLNLLFFHGSPDAPTVDIVTGGSPVFDNVSFGEFSGPVNVPATSYELSVTPADDNETVVAAYLADFGFWSGKSAVVFASGYLGGESPGFEPWVALSNGGTYPLEAIEPESPGLQIPQSEINQQNLKAEIFPNPVSEQINLTINLERDTRLWVEVWTLNGNVIYQQPMGMMSAGKQLVELPLTSQLSNGTYFLRVRSDLMQRTYPIVVKR